MTLPNTIISLIFNEIEEKYWSKLLFLFINEIEWKINHHLNDINSDYKLIEECINKNIFTILKHKNNNLNWNYRLYKICQRDDFDIVKLMINKGILI